MALPQLAHAEQTQEWGPQTILDRLALHSDSNKRIKAQADFQTLCQNDDNFAMFLAKFERLVFEADATAWPDTAKIPLLRTSLPQALKAKLGYQIGRPTDYPGSTCSKLLGIFRFLRRTPVSTRVPSVCVTTRAP